MSFTLAIVVGTLYFTYKPLFKYIKISKLSFAKIKELAKNEDVRAEFRDFSVAQMQKISNFIDSILKKKQTQENFDGGEKSQQTAQETQTNKETNETEKQKKSE